MLDVSSERLEPYIRSEFRASHAGEFGAVWIYRGVLAANWIRRDSEIAAFAHEHMSTEQVHLSGFENWIHFYRGSVLLFFWGIAGFLTGAIPTLLGRNWVYYSIYRVESFVDAHYRKQFAILQTSDNPLVADLMRELQDFHQDELHHRDDALNRMTKSPTTIMRFWGKLIELGSNAAVSIARVL